ncbi:MAG: hypothetical protein ACRELB_14675, partial [Polyangiaceae bacterium]
HHPWLLLLLVPAASVLASSLAQADTPTADACATASDNAQPLRRAGKLGAARDQLRICVKKGCPTIVRDDCASQLNEIDKVMPTVVFAATDAEGRDLSAVNVRMGDELLVDHLDGTPIAVDPGEHLFRFEAAGSPAAVKKLVLHEGEKERRVAVAFAAPSTSSPYEVPGEHAEGAIEAPTRWPGYVALGLGVAGLAVGVIFTVSAVNQNSTLAGECTNGGCDAKYQPQITLYDEDRVLAGIGYGVAIIGAGVGTYLLLASGSSPPRAQWSATQIEPRVGPGWLGIGGHF